MNAFCVDISVYVDRIQQHHKLVEFILGSSILYTICVHFAPNLTLFHFISLCTEKKLEHFVVLMVVQSLNSYLFGFYMLGCFPKSTELVLICNLLNKFKNPSLFSAWNVKMLVIRIKSIYQLDEEPRLLLSLKKK